MIKQEREKQKERRKHFLGTSSTGAGTSLRCISVSHLRGCVFAVMPEMIGLSQLSVQGYLTDWDAQKAIWDGIFSNEVLAVSTVHRHQLQNKNSTYGGRMSE